MGRLRNVRALATLQRVPFGDKETGPIGDKRLGYTMTDEEALGLKSAGEAIPFVDRPAFQGEWGITEEGKHREQGSSYGQGRFLLGNIGEEEGAWRVDTKGGIDPPQGQKGSQWQNILDPANLPRHDMGTPESRREMAGMIGGLESERTKPNPLKQLGRALIGKGLWAPSQEVRDPKGVKDTLAQSGMPPEVMEYLAYGGTEVKENTRDLTMRESLDAKDPAVDVEMGPIAHYKPAKGPSRRDKRKKGPYATSTPVSEAHITTGPSFYSGSKMEADKPETLVHELWHGYHDQVTRLQFGQADASIRMRDLPYGTGGERGWADPHKEGFADAGAELYTSTDTPLGAEELQRNRYGIDSDIWKGPGDDSSVKHAYETMRLHTKSTEATLGPEDESMGQKPVAGILRRLGGSDPHTRTAYATRVGRGGADTVTTEKPDKPFDYEKSSKELRWVSDAEFENDNVVWKTAGQDLMDSVLSKEFKVEAKQSPSMIRRLDADTDTKHGRPGVQTSLGWAPEVDMNEQDTMTQVESVRGGEEHLKRVISDWGTWFSPKGQGVMSDLGERPSNG
jgi:hypothetical protein